ncbi:RNA pseudouridine synthase [Thalassotalea litorea]|uniref:RNA pseudouridine synthase n=1 Tax=Thalassotalea litorea TaxID=2020715 RepID=A0A5R9IL33_9GAMM|nr:RNA pseudouridine synthase [Thalassotalea litorea]TLU64777.1 RNA pseudouridine synthase [Thalassotalea litorea]
MPNSVFEIHHTVTDDSTNCVELLTELSSLSATRIKQVMQQGCVWLSTGKKTTRLRRANRTLKSGQTLHMYFNEEILAQQVLCATLIKDCGHYSVWYKPYGMLSQGSKWSDHTTLTRYVEQKLVPQRPCFLVHRLDRATSGVMVVAHSKTTVRKLTSAFENRQTGKIYHAIVCGDASTLIDKRIDNELDGKNAISVISGIEYDKSRHRSKVKVAIETGRKHQIRRHLSQLSLPIVGDRLYSTPDDGWSVSEDLQLCSIYLAFPDPQSDLLQEFHLPVQWDLNLK